MIAIRGATTINKDDVEEIKKESVTLLKEIIKKNSLSPNKILSMFFSCTPDITKDYPGKFVREELLLKDCAIMHFNEMIVNNKSYMNKCIRVTLFYAGDIDQPFHIYLNDAKNLRKDLRYNFE